MSAWSRAFDATGVPMYLNTETGAVSYSDEYVHCAHWALMSCFLGVVVCCRDPGEAPIVMFKHPLVRNHAPRKAAVERCAVE